MKKLYTILLVLLVVHGSFAGQKPFDYHKQRTEQLNKIKQSQKNKYPTLLSALENTPTLIKYSNWDDFNNIWMGGNAQRLVINNNQVVTSYFLSYNLVDTFSRITYTYDNQGRYLSALSEYKNIMTNTFYPYSRTSITYSPNGLIQTTIIEELDTATNTWINDTKIVFEKNDRGAEVRSIYYYYNNNAWVVNFGYSTKITYLNSNTNKTTEVVDSSYDFNTQSMKASYKFTQTYDANERAVDIRFYDQDFNTGNLILVTQDSIYYDNNGLPNVLVEKEVDAGGNAVDVLKYTEVTWLNYNINSNLFENEPISYNMQFNLSGNWLLVGRFSTTFPDNYGSTIQLEEAYEAGVYVPSFRRTRILNSNSDLIEEKEENYNTNNNNWEVNYGNKYLITYDANNNQSEYIGQNYQTSLNQYVNSWRNEYSDYVLVNTSIINTTKQEFSIYPNPTNLNFISIGYDQLKNKEIILQIFDLTGSLIIEEKKVINERFTKIDISNLNNGIYIIKDNNNYIGKFIKQ